MSIFIQRVFKSIRLLRRTNVMETGFQSWVGRGSIKQVIWRSCQHKYTDMNNKKIFTNDTYFLLIHILLEISKDF